MLKFYRSGRFGDLGDVSPYVYKLETYMRMAGIPYETELMPVDQMLGSGPRNLIPFIDLDGERLGDSSLIIEHLQDMHDDPLGDRTLPDEQRMRAHLLQKMCENELFYIMIYSRWLGGADYRLMATFVNRHVGSDEHEQRIEGSLQAVKDMLHSFRMGRYDEAFVEKSLRRNFDCLAFYLGGQDFFFGTEPHGVDAIAHALVASFVHFPVPNPLVLVAKEYASLVAFSDRIKQRYFPPAVWDDPV